jgi:hypothetical protein
MKIVFAVFFAALCGWIFDGTQMEQFILYMMLMMWFDNEDKK